MVELLRPPAVAHHGGGLGRAAPNVPAYASQKPRSVVWRDAWAITDQARLGRAAGEPAQALVDLRVGHPAR